MKILDKQNVRRHRIALGFTLIEIMIVIAIIAVLISILIPVLAGARKSAHAVACQSNQRQIMAGFLMFAADHGGRLPGNYWDSKLQQPSDPSRRDWLLGDNPNQGNPALQVLDGPQKGTLYKYLKEPGVYRCPSYGEGFLNTGGGSNGRFDYAAVIVFSGARVSTIPLNAQFRHAGTTNFNIFTPVICEEEPAGGINGGNVEGGHCNTDRLGHAHRGGGYYAAIDGSVHWFNEPLNANCHNWFVRAPSGKETTLGPVPRPGWGYWDTQ